MFSQSGKTGDDEGESKEDKQELQKLLLNRLKSLWVKRPLCGQQLMLYTDKSQIGCRSIQEDEARNIW